MAKNVNRLVHEPGKYLNVTPFHGKWATITLRGNDVGYARVGIISSGKDYIYFQFRERKGIVAKMYIKDIVEVPMNERKLRKEQELIVEDWNYDEDYFERFLGTRCDIHVHSTKMFEGNPGFFAARILDVSDHAIHIRENGKEFNVNRYMICGMLESDL